MNANYVDISNGQLIMAAMLIVINGIISIIWRLNLEKSLFIASLRTIVQLGLIGYVLEWVFKTHLWYITLIILVVMTVIAGMAAKGRNKLSYKGLSLDALLAVSLSSWLILFITTHLILHINPWFSPQYIIPLLGMILGNTLTSVALGLERLSHEMLENKSQIELFLAIGAKPWEAFSESARNAMTAAMLPVINSMMVVGLVSLPGMMTGQILAGQSPEQAVRYQILVMFMLGASAGIGSILTVFLCYKRFFNPQQQFLVHLLTHKKTRKKT